MPELIEATFAILTCDICHKPFVGLQTFKKLGEYHFHTGECYQTAIRRLEKLADIIFSSDEDFEKWLAENREASAGEVG